MNEKISLDTGRYNSYVIKTRKIILNKGQLEILDKLLDCVYSAMPYLAKDKIKTLLILAIREWEIENKRSINDFRFIHVNDRMKAFDRIFSIFIELLNQALINPLDEQAIKFVRKSALTNYKDFLEAEGYQVTYQIQV